MSRFSDNRDQVAQLMRREGRYADNKCKLGYAQSMATAYSNRPEEETTLSIWKHTSPYEPPWMHTWCNNETYKKEFTASDSRSYRLTC